jgi:uncharacterized protein (DUF433 family)
MRSTADHAWVGCPALECDPLSVRGALLFRGPRIPGEALFKKLDDGISQSEFLETFPAVAQEPTLPVLEHVARSTWRSERPYRSLRCSPERFAGSAVVALPSQGQPLQDLTLPLLTQRLGDGEAGGG